ncbi:MAG TPA: methylated-DNA--[protein]-cysteine S-methyltransferase [Firmicutes bacterium]|nr:methylated-DNA--[protein]-cysteine S-methyltransferase [Bacillota bacterium]
MISHIIQSPVGPLRITVEDGFVTGLSFHREQSQDSQRESEAPLASAAQDAAFPPAEDAHPNQQGGNRNNQKRKDFNILQQTIKELDTYFTGQLRTFTVPVRLSGTPFQQAVWQAMKNIRYGETKTYRELALAAGSPKAARAVGNACAANPVAIIVPCHRVLAQSGLGGFGGGLDTKRWLLNLEGRKVI